MDIPNSNAFERNKRKVDTMSILHPHDRRLIASAYDSFWSDVDAALCDFDTMEEHLFEMWKYMNKHVSDVGIREDYMRQYGASLRQGAKFCALWKLVTQFAFYYRFKALGHSVEPGKLTRICIISANVLNPVTSTWLDDIMSECNKINNFTRAEKLHCIFDRTALNELNALYSEPRITEEDLQDCDIEYISLIRVDDNDILSYLGFHDGSGIRLSVEYFIFRPDLVNPDLTADEAEHIYNYSEMADTLIKFIASRFNVDDLTVEQLYQMASAVYSETCNDLEEVVSYLLTAMDSLENEFGEDEDDDEYVE